MITANATRAAALVALYLGDRSVDDFWQTGGGNLATSRNERCNPPPWPPPVCQKSSTDRIPSYIQGDYIAIPAIRHISNPQQGGIFLLKFY